MLASSPEFREICRGTLLGVRGFREFKLDLQGALFGGAAAPAGRCAVRVRGGEAAADGATWIWNAVPNAVCVVDIWHAKERLWDLSEAQAQLPVSVLFAWRIDCRRAD